MQIFISSYFLAALTVEAFTEADLFSEHGQVLPVCVPVLGEDWAEAMLGGPQLA